MTDKAVQPDSPTQQDLPPLNDGTIVSGPGSFAFTGELVVEGAVSLRDLTLYLTGPTRVRAGASLTLEGIELIIAEPPDAPNGTSSLHCDGPARLVVADSSLQPVGAAHRMWWWEGEVDMRRFRTHNAELHLRQAAAVLEDTNYFELDVSERSSVQARRLSALFLSTHTGQHENLTFANIAARHPFTAQVALGSGSTATWEDSSLEIFLLYLHGDSRAHLGRVERTQIAFFLQDGTGTYRLPRGGLGTPGAPYLVPSAEDNSRGGPGVSLVDVGVDSWDAYLSGGAQSRFVFVDSVIDEMGLTGQVTAEVDRSLLYADWLALDAEAKLWVRDSTIGARSLAGERADLATSQVKLAGKAQAHFQRVRFDCGILARGASQVTLEGTVVPPQYVTAVDQALISGQ